MTTTQTAPTRPQCPLEGTPHARHYLGRDHRGVSQRCEGEEERDYALTGEGWRETGWTGC